MPRFHGFRVVPVAFWLLWSTSLLAALVWHGQKAARGWSWTTGDWLISFAGGVVRRGLSGEIILRFTPGGLSPSWTVFAIQVLVLATTFASAAFIFMRSSQSWVWFMLTMSPAFLLFFLLSPEGSLRKESLAVAIVGLMACLMLHGSHPRLLWIPIICFSIGSFLHEAIALASPALLILVLIAYKRRIVSRATCVAQFSLVSVAGASSLLFALIVPGDKAQVAVICERARLATGNLEICDGAVSAIGTGLRESLGVVSGLLAWNTGYLSLAVLSLVPMALVRIPRVFWLYAAVVYLALSPLFVLAWDYGRWIFLATSLLTFLAAVLERQGLPEIKVPGVLAVAFVTLWCLPTLSLGQPSLFTRVFTLLYSPFSTWMDARY